MAARGADCLNNCLAPMLTPLLHLHHYYLSSMYRLTSSENDYTLNPFLGLKTENHI